MRAILLSLALFIGIAHAAGSDEGTASWKERNRDTASISSKMSSVPLHGFKSSSSSYDMGVCAASIANTLPATAKRIMDEAIARGERAEFYRGAEALIAQVNRDPVIGWQRGEQACSGHMLQQIRFEKGVQNAEKAAK